MWLLSVIISAMILIPASHAVVMFIIMNGSFPGALYNLVLAGSFLVNLLGWKSVLAGIASSVMIVPFSMWFSKSYSKLVMDQMMTHDDMAHKLTEALQGMRQIRYSGLEQHWENKILESRQNQQEQYQKMSLWSFGVLFFIRLGPVLLSCVALSVYAWENGTDIKASVIFTSLGLLGQLTGVTGSLPVFQMFMVEAWTSCTRLEKFLNQPDREQVADPGDTISFEKATVSWPKADDGDGQPAAEVREERSMLRDISLEFPVGELSVIAGKTGSGKSLLLAAILGEVKLLSGAIRTPTPPQMTEPAPEFINLSEWIVPSLTAYVSQTPWIESGTLKENITFGLPLDELRYRKVLHASALEKDIEHLVDGDLTEVGPKGITLSGGQRWRVALARAIYSRAGILILDDVLSAVDAHVGRTIVDEALSGELARGRTRILATHHAELVLPHAKYLVKLKDGKLETAGAIDDGGTTVLDYSKDEPRISDSAAVFSILSNGTTSSDTTGATPNPIKAGSRDEDDNEEKREVGRVRWAVYKAYYIASGGAPFWILALAILIVNRLSQVAETWALKELSESASTDDAYPNTSSQSFTSQAYLSLGTVRNIVGQDGSLNDIAFWMGIYVLLHLLGSVFMIMESVTHLFIGLRASRILFLRMTHAVLRAPLRWIDTIPSGRILNRFTSDVSALDGSLSRDAAGFLQSCFSLVVIIGTRYASRG